MADYVGDYAGKTVVITGASEGIGRALCLALTPQKPRLVLAARDAARLEDVANECRALGAQTVVVPTDVSDEAACRALAARATSAGGSIDALVLNAGITMWARLDEIQDLGIYERLMRVNYLGSVYLTAAALPALKAACGQIVVVASVAGLTGVPTRTGYSASKHAQVGFFESLRIELLGTGVDVTIVAPDFVRSQIHRRAIGADGQPLGATPLAETRIMTAEECARRIVRAMSRRPRLVILSRRGRWGRWLKLVAPGVIDRVARRAIARGR